MSSAPAKKIVGSEEVIKPTVVGEATVLDLRPFKEALIGEACGSLGRGQPSAAIEIYVSLRKGRDIGTALRADLRPLEERLLAMAEASLVGCQACGEGAYLGEALRHYELICTGVDPGSRNMQKIRVSHTDPDRHMRAVFSAF